MNQTPENKVINNNLKNNIFYHGTNSIEDVKNIFKQGFRTDLYFSDDNSRYICDGNLGQGIYITCNWKIACWFGNIVLSVSLQKGTKILDTSKKHNEKIIKYLIKEFGREIITSSQPNKILPKNKKLKSMELIEIIRYHYYNTWEKDWKKDKDGFSKWPDKRYRHLKSLDSYISILKRYGFHGFGNPSDDNGIVIFNFDRIKVKEIIAYIPDKKYKEIDYGNNLDDVTLKILKSKYKISIKEFLKL